MKLLRKNRKGFTLVELIVVIAIIGILAAILIPQFGGFQERAREKSAISEARAVATALAAYNADNGAYPANKAGLGTDYLDTTNYGEISAVTTSDKFNGAACTAHDIDSSNFKYVTKDGNYTVIAVAGQYSAAKTAAPANNNG